MKKKLLALILMLAVLVSCMLMLTSCPDETPDDPVDNPPAGDNTPDDTTPTPDPELNLNEGVGSGEGSKDVTIITDPTNPDAGKDAEDNYVHG